MSKDYAVSRNSQARGFQKMPSTVAGLTIRAWFDRVGLIYADGLESASPSQKKTKKSHLNARRDDMEAKSSLRFSCIAFVFTSLVSASAVAKDDNHDIRVL